MLSSIKSNLMKKLFIICLILIISGCKTDNTSKLPTEELPLECVGNECNPEIIDSLINEDISIDKSPIFNIKYHIGVSNDTVKLNENDIELLIASHNSLNEAYKGSIIFSMIDSIHYFNSVYSLDEMYDDYLYGGKNPIKTYYGKLLADYSDSTSINIFVMTTNKKNGQTLLGFTPTLKKPELYPLFSPEYNAIAISFEGLFQYEVGSSLIHEIGHWLGLDHPWQYPDSTKVDMGLDSKLEYCINHMNYSCFVDRFTDEQLNFQTKFAIKFRNYLN